MIKFKNKFYQGVLLLGDSFFFVVSVYGAYTLRNKDFYPPTEDITLLTLAFSPIFFITIIAYFVSSLYEVPSLMTTIARTKTIIRLHCISFMFGLSIFYAFPIFGITPKVVLIIQIILFTFLQICWRVYISHHIRTNKKRKALLIGDAPIFLELKETVNGNPQSSIVFAEHIEVNSPLLTGTTIDALKAVLKENEISLLVVDVKNEKMIPLLPYFYDLVSDGIIVYDVTRMYEDVFRRMPLSSVGYFWFFENVTLNMRLYEFFKRCIDIIIAVLVGIIWIIIHPCVAFLIKREDDGPVFLSNQMRIGRNGKHIKLIKYRTMSHDDEGVWLKEKGNKNHVTKIGYYLRRSRIDELPQVINVLRGDISLIGPRPDIIDLGNKMAKEIPFYMIRYSVQPGLSGWAQTLQDIPPQSAEETKIRLMYDLFYIKNRSFILDLVVLLRTIRTLLMRSGM